MIVLLPLYDRGGDVGVNPDHVISVSQPQSSTVVNVITTDGQTHRISGSVSSVVRKFNDLMEK